MNGMLCTGNPRIIHRDIKSTTSLLDYNFEVSMHSASHNSKLDIINYSDILKLVVHVFFFILICLRFWASQISS